MPRIIDYTTVVNTMLCGGFVSLYHNSGAFGFGASRGARSLGWVGPPDGTIREAALPLVRHIPPPFERNLAELAAVAWGESLTGPAWVMPKSHWAYELDFGSHEWLPDLLRASGVDPAALASSNDGSAIEFTPEERQPFVDFLEGLLGRLFGSDFALAFPGQPALCTIHHHKQLWWTADRDDIIAALDRLVPPRGTQLDVGFRMPPA